MDSISFEAYLPAVNILIGWRTSESALKIYPLIISVWYFTLYCTVYHHGLSGMDICKHRSGGIIPIGALLAPSFLFLSCIIREYGTHAFIFHCKLYELIIIFQKTDTDLLVVGQDCPLLV